MVETNVEMEETTGGNTLSGADELAVDLYIGERIKARRIQLGLSMDALGKEIGVSFQSIQKYERGTTRVDSSRLYNIARALRVPFSYFVEDFEEEDFWDQSAEEVRLTEFMQSKEAKRFCEALVWIDRPVRDIFLTLIRTVSGSNFTMENEAHENL